MYFPIFLVVMIILALGLVFTLRTMQSEIQLSNMKSTFVSTVSHEFKSPLTSIRHLAEMLVNDRVRSAKRKKEYYEVILQQSERLGHLVENILDFSKMEAGRNNFKFEEIELVSFVKEKTAAFQENVIARGFEINISEPEDPIRVRGDQEALEQVIFNLLDNACKYSGESKNIEVKIESRERNASIMVMDSGVGIPEKEHDKIFRRFYRVDDERNQSVKGAGIGLSIVKRIVEEHHGKITVTSSPGKGTTILVEIPLMQ
jgi:two-component system phosphate regulon sensor histidine kinase PhoR